MGTLIEYLLTASFMVGVSLVAVAALWSLADGLFDADGGSFVVGVVLAVAVVASAMYGVDHGWAEVGP